MCSDCAPRIRSWCPFKRVWIILLHQFIEKCAQSRSSCGYGKPCRLHQHRQYRKKVSKPKGLVTEVTCFNITTSTTDSITTIMKGVYYMFQSMHCKNSLVGPTVFLGPRNAAEFGFFRSIWAEFAAEFVFFRRIWRFSFEQLFFHRKWPQSSSVTNLFMMIFCLMVMVEWWNWWLMNE